MKKLLILFLILSTFQARSQEAPATSIGAPSVTIDIRKPIHPIHPDFWGTNFLFWLDDDAALQSGAIVKSIKDLGMRVLRYPGGTVADNFHWRTNTLDNNNMFPYDDGLEESDFDEFMEVCRQTGAEPELVLNTESWAVKNDYPGGAHEAAEWIRYCKKKGYKVKYVEIGNETYWHPVLSAEEYGKLINIYADSLRKVDPNLIIGINGHWNIEFTGTKERIKAGAYEQLTKYRQNITSRKEYARYTAFKEQNTEMPITKGNVKWWETLSRIAGENIDMIVVHWYFAPWQLSMVTERLTEVRQLFAKAHPGKNYLLNISEYNVTTRTPESHMHLTEMLGAILKAKTDITGLWPMRMKYKKPTLLDYATDQESILFEIHKKLAKNMKGSLVETIASENIPSFATSAEKSVTLVMTGSKVDKLTPVTINIPGRNTGGKANVWRISGKEFEYKIREETVDFNGGKGVVNVGPGEVVIAVIF